MPVSMVFFRVTFLALLSALLAGCEPAPADALPAAAPAVATQAAIEDGLPVPATPVDDIAPPAAASASVSEEEVDGAIGDLEPIRSLLFADSGVLEESIETRALSTRQSVVLAIGRADIATFIVYVLRPADRQPEVRTRSRYLVASRVLPQPQDVLDGALRVSDWTVDDAGRVHLAVDLRHDLMPAGGDAGGAAATTPLEQRVAFVFDPATGLLETEDG